METTTTTITTPVTIPRPDIDPERVRKPDEYCPEQKRRLIGPGEEP